MKYVSKIPGSIMLFGEHAVLHGSWSIVCAVDQYITVTLMPRTDNNIVINSDSLGCLQMSLRELSVVAPFEFVLTAIMRLRHRLSYGFDLHIASDFSHQIGLGSSAAVTVATLSVLLQWLSGKEADRKELLQHGREVVLQVQGIGSGADVAASVYRGVVAYKNDPMTVKQLTKLPPITLVYSGRKEATKKVVALVEQRRKQHPAVFAALFAGIESCVNEAVLAIDQGDWSRVGALMNIHQGLQDALGVSNQLLSDLIFRLRSHDGIYGAKISGSGLGDCIVGLGRLSVADFSLPSGYLEQGVKIIDVNAA